MCLFPFLNYYQLSHSCMEEDSLYLVEDILDKRFNSVQNQTEYLIKWKGWSQKYNSWQPSQHMAWCHDFLKQFQDKQKKKLALLQVANLEKINLEQIGRELKDCLVQQVSNIRTRLQEIRDGIIAEQNQKIIISEPIRVRLLEMSNLKILGLQERVEKGDLMGQKEFALINLRNQSHFKPFLPPSVQTHQQPQLELEEMQEYLSQEQMKEENLLNENFMTRIEESGEITLQDEQVIKIKRSNRNRIQKKRSTEGKSQEEKVSRSLRLKTLLFKRNIEIKGMRSEQGIVYYELGLRNRSEVLLEATKEDLIQLNQRLLLKYYKRRIIDCI